MTFQLVDESQTRALVRMALAEDLGNEGDLTGFAVLPPDVEATVNIVARRDGVLAGLRVARMVFEEVDPEVQVQSELYDGDRLRPGMLIARVSGPVRKLLAGERTALNFLTHLSGVATLTGQFVDAVQGTRASILDTRKTLPGYRGLQKDAVRCGGGTNHRQGLYDAILIKDNHLAFVAENDRSIADVLKHACSFGVDRGVVVEIEVDTLEQLAAAMPARPDIVLLDNMSTHEMRQAVEMRDEVDSMILLEASGGVTLQNVRSIALTGVDRISIGALTHSAPALDIAFDWPTDRR